MNIEELKAITELDDTTFGKLYALSKLDENTGIKKEAKKALERTRPTEIAAMKTVFRGTLGGDDSKFSKKLATLPFDESLLVAVARSVLPLTGDSLGYTYLCSVGGEAALFALQSSLGDEGHLMLHGFKGALPPELADVKGIKSLSILGNKLTAFPEVLYALTELETLSFSETKIKKLGNEFSKLKKLTTLSIGMPLKKGLGQLPALKKLRIGAVPDVAQYFLPSLEEFTMGDDTQKKIPAEIGQMKNLKKLYWPREVTEIDDALWTLTELEELELSGLEMQTLPEGIGNLTKLKVLGMRGVRLTSLPDSFGNLQSLEELDLVFARTLTNVPPSFYKLPLKRLRIQYSPLEKNQGHIEKAMPNVTIYK